MLRSREPRVRSSAALSAVVTDVDGTLTDARRRLDPEALATIHRLGELRVPVILATGNVLPVALGLYRSLGLTTPIVAENGGLLYLPTESRVLRLADPSVALRAFRRLRRAKLPVRRLFTDRWRESEVALDTSVPISRIRRALRGFPIQVEGTGFAIHLIEPGAGKAPALARALHPLGRTLADCLVLGDGDNDVEMLRAAGWAVSFPNGSRAARAAADYVTRANFAQGFVEGVKSGGLLDRRRSR
ncbi:MAG: HAD hydrolase family protein [Candidatus Thermoplasmatota archaeon]|jgi:phosphoglycolate phosphatase (TIGR01487 family)|nr:HAD hydrolase family protein [Candidatus Thermoplasmatota archaeon]MCL5983199.1 HAD hydrolase family protein [Candidatus Thermoplasmatota archaeon]